MYATSTLKMEPGSVDCDCCPDLDNPFVLNIERIDKCFTSVKKLYCLDPLFIFLDVDCFDKWFVSIGKPCGSISSVDSKECLGDGGAS